MEDGWTGLDLTAAVRSRGGMRAAALLLLALSVRE
jgi:hypothetical protein